MALDLLSCIKSFVAVVDYSGFAAAARRMHISPPVLTKHIKLLEHTLQKPLLQRTTRRVQLTEAGEIYLPHARKILLQVGEASQAINVIEKEPHGHIVLGIPTSLNAKFLGKSLKQFLDKYPKITLQVHNRISPHYIMDGLADLVITGVNTQDNQLVKKHLFTSKSGIYAAPCYLKKKGTPKTIAELKNHNCLINTYFSPQNEWEFENNKRIIVKSNYKTDSGIDVLFAGINGLGLFSSIEVFLEEEIKKGLLTEVKLDFIPVKKDIYLYHRPSPQGNIVRLLADYIVQVTKDCCKANKK